MLFSVPFYPWWQQEEGDGQEGLEHDSHIQGGRAVVSSGAARGGSSGARELDILAGPPSSCGWWVSGGTPRDPRG